MRLGTSIFGAALTVVLFGWETLSAVPAPAVFGAFNSEAKGVFQGQGVSPEVAQALELEVVLARARAGEEPGKWLPELRRFSRSESAKGAALALREMALYWEARAQVLEFDQLLRTAYRKKAVFPEKMDDILAAAPESLRRDPWGEAWVYQRTAPAHSPKLVGQRYQLGPTRRPGLLPLDAVSKRPPVKPEVRLEYSSFSGGNAQSVVSLKVQGGGGASAGHYQPGQRFGDYWVVWLHPGGVLLAHPDGFVPVAF